MIQFIINHCIKNLCANLLVSKKDLLVWSDSQRSEPYNIHSTLMPCCVSGDRATAGVIAVAVADAKLDDRERLRHLQRRQRV